MNWPTHSDYQDAMQNPANCFQEPELKSGEAATDMLGLPRVMSGNFASVYELRTPTGRWAVRCFVRQVPGQQGRYARLSQYLNSLKVPYLVNFEYMLKGILVKGEWYPIVKMHWVEGSPLNTFLDENYKNPQAMHKLASDFREMLKSMRELKIAHGDLQHGNIMVTPQAELRLVDYDGMYAPVFGRGRAPELGHANFQHPRRTADYYEESLDNFSALVLYTTFRALAADPSLWEKFYEVDNLIFTSGDYKAPLQSAAFDGIKKSNDPQVQQLAELLVKSSCAGVEQVPDFADVMAALDAGTLDKLEIRTASAAPVDPQPFKQKLDALKTVAASTSSQYSGSRPAEMSRPAPAQSRASAAPRMPPEEKSAIPPWAIWAAAGFAALVIGFFVFIAQNTKDDAPQRVANSDNDSPPIANNANPSPPVAPPKAAPASKQDIKLLGTLKGHSGPVEEIAFSPDGKLLITAGGEHAVRIWDLNAGKAIRAITGLEEEIRNVSFMPDGKKVVGVTADNVIHIWDISSGKLLQQNTNYIDNLFIVTLSPIGNMAATGASDRRVFQLVNLATGAKVQVFGGHPSWIKQINFSADGKYVAALCHDDSVTLWDITSGRKIQTFVSEGNTAGTAIISPDGKHAAVVNNAKLITILDLESGAARQTLYGHQKDIICYSFAPRGALLASSGEDITIKIWNYATANNVQNLTGHHTSVLAMAFSRDGKLLATGSGDGQILLWMVP